MKSYIVTNEKLYHEQVADWYVKRNETDFIWQVPEEMSLLTPKYIPTSGTIVDMGCGPAHSMKAYFEKHGHLDNTYIGIDIAKNMLSYAKKNIPWGTFYVGDIQRTGLKQKSLTCIISLGALHHTQDQKATIIHWLNLLKSSGVLLLREPTKAALPQGAGESPYEVGIDLTQLLRNVTRSGGKVVHVQEFNTGVFHICNKIAIKLKLGNWVKYKILWYPVTYVDFFLAHFGSICRACKGTAFLLVIKKI